MSSLIADVEANAMVRGRFGGVTPTKPASWFVALYLATSTPALAGGVITGLTEVTVAGYARVETPNDSAHWQDIARGLQNAAQVLFPEAGDDPLGYFGLCSGSSAAPWYVGALSGSVDPSPGVPLYFEAGDLVIDIAESV